MFETNKSQADDGGIIWGDRGNVSLKFDLQV